MCFHFGLYVIGLPQVLQGLVRNSGSMGSGLETGLEAGSVVVWVPFEKIFFIKSNKGYPPDVAFTAYIFKHTLPYLQSSMETPAAYDASENDVNSIICILHSLRNSLNRSSSSVTFVSTSSVISVYVSL